jgi:hypothetical protein
MAEIEDGGPAFPVAQDHRTANAIPWTAGMSLRDYYAGQAMAALIALDWSTKENIAIAAYAQADAMLAERSKKP